MDGAARVELRPIGSLTAYDRNARKHSAKQIEKIAASIREFGFNAPVLVDGKGVILAGHGRIEAARKLGLKQVPVVPLTHLNDAQRRAYILADNRIADEATWDEDLLAAELAALSADGFDLELTGFDIPEIDDLLDHSAGSKDDPRIEAAPEPPAEPVSRLGDIWVLGPHRLMCGDSCSEADVSALCAGVVPDLANCDPPYGISVVKGATVGGAKPFGNTGGGNAPFGGWKNGDRSQGPARQGRVHGPARRAIIPPGVYAPIIGDDSTDTAIASYGVLSALGVPSIVLWGGNYFANALPPSRCWLVWDKENTGTFADAELAWTNRDAVVRLFRHQWSGLIKASERGERRVHPTQKPVALAEWVFGAIAPESKTVIDLFCGSGSTLIACERKRKAGLLMEMAPAYVDVAVRRWQEFAKGEAVLEGDGRAFSEIAGERLAAAA